MTLDTATQPVISLSRRQYVCRWLYRFYLHRQTRRALEKLNDDQLKDIGLSRGDIHRRW